VDTRSKILTVEKAAALVRELCLKQQSLQVVTGYFEVLLAAHVEALSRLKEAPGQPRLLALVCDPPDPVLSAAARAEIVAALGVIDYVVTAAPENREQALAALGVKQVTAFEPDDERRIRQLVQHVHRRQRG